MSKKEYQVQVSRFQLIEVVATTGKIVVARPVADSQAQSTAPSVRRRRDRRPI